MATEENSSETANPNPASVTKETEEQAATNEASISKADFDRAMKDMHKFKAQAKTLEEKLKTRETEELKKREEYKTLYEQADKRAKEAEERDVKREEAFIGDKKFSALKIEAMKLGLRAEAMPDLELVGLDEIVAESTSTGKTNILYADKAAQRLKQLRPHWFDSNRPPKINTNSPGVVSGASITIKDVMAAENKAKSGDPEDQKAYLTLIRKFQAQGQK